MTSIENSIKKIIAHELEITEDEIGLDSSLQEDFGADDLDCLAIFTKIELTLGKSISGLKEGVIVRDIVKAAEAAKTKEVIRPRAQHYEFAHKVLPKLLFKDPNYIINLLSSTDGVKHLIEWWNNFGDGFGSKRLSSDGLGCEYRKLVSSNDAIIIKFPTPQGATEALYSAIFYGGFDKNILHYFTFELSAYGYYILGEWCPNGERRSVGANTYDISVNGFIDLIFSSIPALCGPNQQEDGLNKDLRLTELERGKACNKCNIKFDDSKKFCTRCGSQLDSVQKIDAESAVSKEQTNVPQLMADDIKKGEKPSNRIAIIGILVTLILLISIAAIIYYKQIDTNSVRVVAKTTKASMSEKELTTKVWQFGRGDGSILAGKIRLLPGGKIEGYTHPNESRWGMKGKALFFYHESGQPSTRFNSFKRVGNKWIIKGQFLLGGNATHVLKEVN